MGQRRVPADTPSGQPSRSRLARVSTSLNARIARWLLIVVAVAGVLTATWLTVTTVTSSDAQVTVISAQGATLDDLAGAELPAGTTLRFEHATGPLVLHIDDVALGLRLLASAADLLALGLWVGAAVAVAGIIGEIVAGRPFTTKVSRRLTMLIGIAVIGSFVPSAVDNLASLVLMLGAGITPPDSVFGMQILDVNLAALLAAIVLASLDQAIRHGRKLTADVEGLV